MAVRDEHPRSFDPEDQMLNPCDLAQVEAWAEFYETTLDAIREACEAVGGHRTAVELKLAAPKA